MSAATSFGIVLAALLLAGGGRAGAEPSGPAAEIDAYVSRFASRGGFSGAVLVERAGAVVIEKAYGKADYELGVPNTPDTRFLLASVTKTFTAAAVLHLRDAGKLELDKPVGRHLPDFPHGDRITPRHLLSHSSGLRDFHDLGSFDEIRLGRHTLAELIGRLRGEPLEFEPGSSNRYNNAGYVALALLVERISGRSYEEYLRAHFFGPLGMKDTGLFDRQSIIENRASGYRVGPPPAGLLNAEWFDGSYLVGSGGLYSTLGDLRKWGRAVRDKKVVDVFAEPWPYGWGRRRDDETGLEWIEQTGLLPGFQSCLKVYTNRDAAIVYLGNSQTAAFSRFKNDLETILFELERETFEPPPLAGPPPASYRRFLGRYQHPDAGPFRLALERGHLYLFWEKFDARRYLAPVSADTLYETSEGVFLELHTDDGAPSRVIYRAPWGTVECPGLPE